MNLIQLSTASLAVLLSACVAGPTPSTLVSGPPDAVYTSDKAAKAIADCIIDKWENTQVIGSGAIANARPSSTGYRATMHFAEKLMYLAEIDETKFGSKTKIYVNPSMVSLGKNPTVGQAANCQ